ncbi:MAG: hypothetical protein IJ343_13915 [Clostridia bacterium]|nr:hypothetical protein [Clostridia bacterium]
MNKPEISLRVPGRMEYALVLRLALGGVAILKDLDAGTLDDLRAASDEACDCLLHQGMEAAWLELNVMDCGSHLTVSVAAEFIGDAGEGCGEEEMEISRTVLETLVPKVGLQKAECGCVCRIDLTLPKAVSMGA